MTISGAEEEEARIDASLKEIERSVAELLKKKQELVRAKEVLRAEKRDGAIRSAPSAGAEPQPAKGGVPSAQTSQVPPSTKALEAALNAMEWSSFKKREGEWTFLRTREGKIADALESQTDFVNQLRRGKEVVVGRYRYRVSEDRFLNRFFEA